MVAALNRAALHRGLAPWDRALRQLVNGAHKGLGPFRLDLTRFARSMPSLHQLMPEYACISKGTALLRTTEAVLPDLDTAMVTDALRFHTTLRDAEAQRPGSLTATHPIIGTNQTTATTIRLTGGYAELIGTYQGQDLAGDSTVPIVAACRPDVRMDSNTLRRVPDKHGNLQSNRAALDEVEGIRTAREAGQDITVEITPCEPSRHAVRLTVTSETGNLVEARILRPTGTTMTTTVGGLPPGAYNIDATGTSAASPYAPVSSSILIWAAP